LKVLQARPDRLVRKDDSRIVRADDSNRLRGRRRLAPPGL